MPANNPAAYLNQNFSSPLANLMRNLAVTDYQRSMLNRQGTVGQRDMERQFRSMREAIPGQFARRGMVNSGLHNKAWGDQFASQDRGFGGFQSNLQNQYMQLQQDQVGAENRYAGTRAQRDYDAGLRRANIASQIRGLG